MVKVIVPSAIDSHISRPSARMMPASPILLTPCR
jgi:hypothetical protein